jgi:hypothetical protein
MSDTPPDKIKYHKENSKVSEDYKHYYYKSAKTPHRCSFYYHILVFKEPERSIREVYNRTNNNHCYNPPS